MVTYNHQSVVWSLYKRLFLGVLRNKNAVLSATRGCFFIRVLYASNLGRDPPFAPPAPPARIGGVTPKYFPLFH